MVRQTVVPIQITIQIMITAISMTRKHAHPPSPHTVPSSSGQDAVLSAQKTGVQISSAPPYLGVAHLAERSLWKREAEGAAPSAQTNFPE
jgi:hypothetical protein